MASFWIFIFLALASGIFIFVNVFYSFKIKGIQESLEEAKTQINTMQDINTSKGRLI